MGNIGTLNDCLAAIKEWMSLNFLSAKLRQNLSLKWNPVSSLWPPMLTPSSRKLDVIFDQNLNFDPHINKLVQTCFFQLQNVTKIESMLSTRDLRSKCSTHTVFQIYTYDPPIVFLKYILLVSDVFFIGSISPCHTTPLILYILVQVFLIKSTFHFDFPAFTTEASRIDVK